MLHALYKYVAFEEINANQIPTYAVFSRSNAIAVDAKHVTAKRVYCGATVVNSRCSSFLQIKSVPLNVPCSSTRLECALSYRLRSLETSLSAYNTPTVNAPLAALSNLLSGLKILQAAPIHVISTAYIMPTFGTVGRNVYGQPSPQPSETPMHRHTSDQLPQTCPTTVRLESHIHGPDVVWGCMLRN